jgi:hypothetical protein
MITAWISRRGLLTACFSGATLYITSFYLSGTNTMKEIGIFEVEKGKTCGVIKVPRKIIGSNVKVFLIEPKDERSQINHKITIIENEIRNLEFQRDSLKLLPKIRAKRELMGIR